MSEDFRICAEGGTGGMEEECLLAFFSSIRNEKQFSCGFGAEGKVWKAFFLLCFYYSRISQMLKFMQLSYNYDKIPYN